MMKREHLQFILELLTPEQTKKLKEYIDSQEKEKPESTGIEAIEDKEAVSKKKDPMDFSINHNRSNKEEGRKGTPIKASGNTWTDNGSEEKDNFDELVKRHRTPRDRPHAQKKKVTCSSCHKEKEVPGSLITGKYYRCESCTGGG